ncbi:MAG: hypothetical protein NZ108_01525, partial [Bacteroidia bacterium]|nr:hypothetical protein [Bacteroidia bacterium]
ILCIIRYKDFRCWFPLWFGLLYWLAVGVLAAYFQRYLFILSSFWIVSLVAIGEQIWTEYSKRLSRN